MAMENSIIQRIVDRACRLATPPPPRLPDDLRSIAHAWEIRKFGYRIGFLDNGPESREILKRAEIAGLLAPGDVIVETGESGRSNYRQQRLDIKSADLDNRIDCLFLLSLPLKSGVALWAIKQELMERHIAISIFDSLVIPHHGAKDEDFKYHYRGLDYQILPGTFTPQYWSNGLFIDGLIDRIDGHGVQNFLDIGTGQGCIGLSCLRESRSNISVTLADINPECGEAVKKTIAINSLDRSDIKFCLNDGFRDIPEDKRFDLITANPPHTDANVKSIRDRTGIDEDWRLHKDIFTNGGRFLTDDGLIVVHENSRSGYMLPKFFVDLAHTHCTDLELFDWDWIRGSYWYRLYLRKKS